MFRLGTQKRTQLRHIYTQMENRRKCKEKPKLWEKSCKQGWSLYSRRRRTNTRGIKFFMLHGGQLTLSTLLLIQISFPPSPPAEYHSFLQKLLAFFIWFSQEPGFVALQACAV